MQTILFCESGGGIFAEHLRRKGEPSMAAHHIHSTLELYYLLTGEGAYFIEDKTYPMAAGSFAFLRPGCVHRTLYEESGCNERLLLQVEIPLLPTISSLLPGVNLAMLDTSAGFVAQLPPQQAAHAANLMQQVMAELKEKQQGWQQSIYLATAGLLLLAVRSYSNAAQPLLLGEKHRRIYEVTRYLAGHYSEPLVLTALAEHFYISKYHLCRAFKEVTGLTVTQYLAAVRTQQAQLLLAVPTTRITEVAQAVGYDSITHFERVFRQNTGLTPSQYRKTSHDTSYTPQLLL